MDSQGSPSEVRAVGADDPDLQPGQKVGEYVVDHKIGEGGFGTVFRATHPLIGKVAAIKVLARQYSAQPEMVSRFVAEARAVNQIRHRNIIDIFAFGQLADGRHYYVMEFLDGAPLDEYLAQVGKLSLGEAVPILRAVARALDAAHAKGIAHRDLKPENIFLAREADGTVYPVLLDFGIAKLLGTTGGAMHKTRTGAPLGTPYYMSPEQCRGRDVDQRTDVYAFGVVAFKLLTGEVPFDGDDYMDILLKQIQEEPPPPSSRNPELPASVDQGILWMLKKDPAERPANLVTAVRALEDAAVAAGFDIPASPPSAVHAATSSRLATQQTPSGVAPLPRAARDSSSLANAATVDAARLSAVQPAPVAAAESAAMPRRARWAIPAAVVAAAVCGAIVFTAVRASQAPDAEAKPAVAARPAPPHAPAAQPTPPTPPTPPPAPPPVAPVQPALVTIQIDGPPAGTEVYGPGGRLLGTVPGPVQLERADQEVVLTLRADGYTTRSMPVRASADAAFTVELESKGAPAHADTAARPPAARPGAARPRPEKGKAGRNELEDPF